MQYLDRVEGGIVFSGREDRRLWETEKGNATISVIPPSNGALSWCIEVTSSLQKTLAFNIFPVGEWKEPQAAERLAFIVAVMIVQEIRPARVH